MKTLIVLAAILLTGAASAATVKQAWNLLADATIANGTTNGYVTLPGNCRLDNAYLFSCTNEHERVEEEEKKDEKYL